MQNVIKDWCAPCTADLACCPTGFSYASFSETLTRIGFRHRFYSIQILFVFFPTSSDKALKTTQSSDANRGKITNWFHPAN